MEDDYASSAPSAVSASPSSATSEAMSRPSSSECQPCSESAAGYPVMWYHAMQAYPWAYGANHAYSAAVGFGQLPVQYAWAVGYSSAAGCWTQPSQPAPGVALTAQYTYGYCDQSKLVAEGHPEPFPGCPSAAYFVQPQCHEDAVVPCIQAPSHQCASTPEGLGLAPADGGHNVEASQLYVGKLTHKVDEAVWDARCSDSESTGTVVVANSALAEGWGCNY